ncbi:MAG: hypothetical protein ACUVWR_02295 [Anaerolineae bacterium]
MSIEMPIKAAKDRLEDLLEELDLGETITLLGAEGTPLGLLVSLKATQTAVQSPTNWDACWDALSEEVSHAWKSEKGAVEILAEMRR